jgi:hypothetical protein
VAELIDALTPCDNFRNEKRSTGSNPVLTTQTVYSYMIREKTTRKEIIIDLSGPDGNAFALIGKAKQYAKQLGLDGDLIKEEMMSRDYENLIRVFDRYFGDFIILER